MITREEILNMPAGKDMDALIAEKFGLYLNLKEHRIREGDHFVYTGEHQDGVLYFHPFSTDIRAAWEVVEKLRTHPDQILFGIAQKGADMESLLWWARFRKCKGTQREYYTGAETAPLAICRAALLAVMDGPK